MDTDNKVMTIMKTSSRASHLVDTERYEVHCKQEVHTFPSLDWAREFAMRECMERKPDLQ